MSPVQWLAGQLFTGSIASTHSLPMVEASQLRHVQRYVVGLCFFSKHRVYACEIQHPSISYPSPQSYGVNSEELRPSLERFHLSSVLRRTDKTSFRQQHTQTRDSIEIYLDPTYAQQISHSIAAHTILLLFKRAQST